MSVLDTAEYRRLALIAAGVDPCDIPCILDTATWRRLMLQAIYDLSQGGGGSPGYINGSVQFYADLPVTVGTPAVNTAYLVRENSGVWFINRKPAGIYVRLFNNGNLNDWDYAGTFPEVNDAQYFRIYDSADPTREVAFNVSGVAAGTTRTIAVPDKNITLDDSGDTRDPKSHTHAATDITSGTLDNSRVNFASPSPIGSTTPAAGAFTTLSASTSLTLGTSGILSGGANLIEQRNTTNAQTFRLYNTYTDANNYERGFMRWSSNVLQIGTEKAGTGSARALELQSDGVTRLTIQTGGTVALSSHLTVENGFIRIASAQALQWLNRSKVYSLADGNIGLYNAGENGFNLLQFGGITSSFPALKRSSTALQVRLANDSNFTAIQGKLTTETAYNAGAPTATGYLVLYDSNGTAYKVPAEAL